MPAIVAVLGVAIKVLLAYAITRALLAFGLAYVTYSGMTELLDFARGAIEGYYNSLPGALFEILTLCGADVAISILFSAISIRLLINGFKDGTKNAFRIDLT